MAGQMPWYHRPILIVVSGALAFVLAWSLPATAESPSGIPPTVTNAQCNGTRLTFDIVNQNGFGVNVSVDYGPAWSGWGDFWVPPNATSGFLVDQGVSCAGALPLTIQGWGVADQCPWPLALGRCGQPRATAWRTPVVLERGSSDALSPQLAIDENGNAIAVWHQSDGFWFGVWTSQFIPGVGWGEARQLDTSASDHDTSPHVAMGGYGTAVAVWYQGAERDIWANRFVPGLGWGAAKIITSALGAGTARPRVAVDGYGNALAVWEQASGCCDTDIWANRFVVGSGWGTPVQIEANTGVGSWPRIAVDRQGNAVAVWQHWVGSRFDVWANRYTLGTGWGTATRIETNDLGSAEKPAVAVDGMGNAIAIWHHPNSIWANRFEAGTGWGIPTLLETGAGEAFDPQVAMDGQGTALAVWKQLNGSRFDVWANRYSPAEGWGIATLIESDDSGHAQNPQVAMDSAGRGTVAWEQSDGSRFNLWTTRFVPGVGWGVPGVIEIDNAGDALLPQVAVSRGGDAAAVWQQSDGVRFNIWASQFIPDLTPPVLVLTSPSVELVNDPTVVVAGCTEPGAIVTINGSPVAVNSSGLFSSTVPLAEGANTIAVVTSDREGNTASATKSITRDSTPPTLVVGTPAEGSTFTTGVVPVSGTVVDALSGVAELNLNGFPIAIGAGGTWSANLSLQDGVRTITSTAVDRAGNVAIVVRTVTVDTQAPVLSVTSPSVQLTNDTGVVVAGTTEPGATVTVNGSPVAVNATGTFEITVPLSEGTNTITVIASDGEGNTASETKSITRDSTPPTLVVATPAGGSTFTTGVVRVSGTVVDALSGLSDVGVNDLRVAVNAGGTWSANLSLQDGVQTITSTAVDRAGNVAIVVRTVTVDTQAPVLSLTSPAVQLTNETGVVVAGSTEPGATVTVNGVSVTVDATGAFSETVALVEGPNAITVTARDAAGNVETASVTVVRRASVEDLERNLLQARSELAALGLQVLLLLGFVLAALALNVIQFLRPRRSRTPSTRPKTAAASSTPLKVEEREEKRWEEL